MAKTDKICIVCGEGFKGTAKAECCGSKCRKRLQRLRKAGKKPEYALIGGKKTQAQKGASKQENETYKEPPAPPSNLRKPFMSDAIKKKLGIK